MFELTPLHVIVILVALLLMFGPKKLPELGRGLGESIREFKKSMAEARADQAVAAAPAAAKAEEKK